MSMKISIQVVLNKKSERSNTEWCSPVVHGGSWIKIEPFQKDFVFKLVSDQRTLVT